MADHYLATESAARAAVARLVERWNSGEFHPEVGFDLETSPLKSLVAYPGTRWGQVKGENGQYELGIIKPDKKEYLMYAQKVWAAHFNPWLLYNLGLFLPTKFTTGKEEDGRTAGEAWQIFHDRLLELSDEQITSCAWNQKAFEVYIERKKNELSDLERTYRFCGEFIARGKPSKDEGLAAFTLFPSLRQYTKNQTFTVKAAETAQKKLSEQVNALSESIKTLAEDVNYHFESPIDVKILRHVINVAVEGRIKVNNGRNGLDPVKPGLDPHTSEIFLAQFTFYTKENECENYIFNHHAYDYNVVVPLLALENALYLGANIKFDLGLTMVKLGDKYKAPMNVYCTQVASRMLYLGIDVPHNLAAVAKRFLKRDISKEVRDTFIGRWYAEPTPEQLEYASLDTEILRPLYLAQQRFAEKHGQVELTHTFSKLSWVVAVWESQGYRIDVSDWMNITAETTRKANDAASIVEKMLLPEGIVLSPINVDNTEEDEEEGIDSRPDAYIKVSQTARVAAEVSRILGFDVSTVFRDGKVSLKSEMRGMIEREYRKRNNGETHPFFKAYDQWSKLAKMVSTYGKKFTWAIHPLTGNVHPRFMIAGTDTGRFTSTGPNLLNIPAAKNPGDPDFRSAFRSPVGKLQLGADFETMEFRIAGDLSRDPVVQTMAKSGADAHGLTATLMFHVDVDDIEAPELRAGVYQRGAVAYDIKTWFVPRSWTPAQVAEFALTDEGMSAMKAVEESYEKAITRTDAKAVTFLWIFGGQAFTLAQRTGLSEKHCEGLFGRFADVYTVMDSYMKEQAELVYTQFIKVGEDRYAYSVGYGGIRRYVKLPHNPHPQEFSDWDAYRPAAKAYEREMGSVKRAVVNLLCQGGNAVITAEALNHMAAKYKDIALYPALAIYDEIICYFGDNVPPERAKYALEESMVGCASKYMTFVPPGAEANIKKVGNHWVKS